jgi:hypothetical protein
MTQQLEETQSLEKPASNRFADASLKLKLRGMIEID